MDSCFQINKGTRQAVVWTGWPHASRRSPDSVWQPWCSTGVPIKRFHLRNQQIMYSWQVNTFAGCLNTFDIILSLLFCWKTAVIDLSFIPSCLHICTFAYSNWHVRFAYDTFNNQWYLSSWCFVKESFFNSNANEISQFHSRFRFSLKPCMTSEDLEYSVWLNSE